MTMIHPLRAPKISPNDDRLLVVKFLADDGELVKTGREVVELEGAKTVVAVESPVSGIFYPFQEVGTEVPIGDIVGVITPTPMTRNEILATLASDRARQPEAPLLSATGSGVRFSKAAAAWLDNNGYEADRFAGHGLVTVSRLQAILAGEKEGRPDRGLQGVVPSPGRPGANQRVLLAGAGPGAHQVLDILLRDCESEVIGLLDDNPEKHAWVIRGIPVLGPLEHMNGLAAENKADSVLCTTPTAISFRQKVAVMARAAGLRLATAIHASAIISETASIAPGSVIGALCYIGPETILGENCFLSSRTTFEHHNQIGSWVTTGPNVATSGLVVVGSGVRFGSGIVVEPKVTIGDNATVASGSVVTNDIPAYAILKRGADGKPILQPRKAKP